MKRNSQLSGNFSILGAASATAGLILLSSASKGLDAYAASYGKTKGHLDAERDAKTYDALNKITKENI